VESQEVAKLLGAGSTAGRVASAPTVQPRRSASRVVPHLPLVLDGLRVSLFLLIVINVSRVHQAIAIVGKARPALTLVFLAGAFVLLRPKAASTAALFKTTEAKLIAALFVLACVSAVAGISLGNSAKFILENYVKVVIAAFLLLAGIRHTRDLYTLVFAYVAACGILAGMALFMFRLTRGAEDQVARLGKLYTFDANDIGVVLMVGLPLAILIFRHSTGLRKWLAIGVVMAIGASLARSGSRGALVGLVATGGFLLLALKTIPVWKRAAFVCAVGIGLAIAAPPGYWLQMKTILGYHHDYNWTSEDGRRQLIVRGLGYMMSNPATGLGIYNFARAECLSDLSEKVRNYVRGTGIRCTAPHNTYIEVGAETGITGLVLWSLLVLCAPWRMRKLRRRLPAGWKRGDAEQRFLYDATLYLPVAVMGFAFTSFFVTFAWIDIIYIVMVFQAGLTLVVKKRLAQEQGAVTPAPSRRGSVPLPVQTVPSLPSP